MQIIKLYFLSFQLGNFLCPKKLYQSASHQRNGGTGTGHECFCGEISKEIEHKHSSARTKPKLAAFCVYCTIWPVVSELSWQSCRNACRPEGARHDSEQLLFDTLRLSLFGKRRSYIKRRAAMEVATRQRACCKSLQFEVRQAPRHSSVSVSFFHPLSMLHFPRPTSLHSVRVFPRHHQQSEAMIYGECMAQVASSICSRHAC